MTELEQMKKEYSEIPIPTTGPHQLLETMADAKRKRNRIKQISRYASMAAAAVLVILVLPRMQLFSGGSDANSESAVMESCGVEEKGIATDTLFDCGNTDNDATGSVNMAPASGSANLTMDATSAPERVEANSAESSKEELDYAATSDLKNKTDDISIGLTKQEKEAVSEEILRQMEERMQSEGAIYHIESEDYPEDFEIIADAQKCYINEDGLLVVVFEAGSVAPETEGVMEFIIPKEIFTMGE